jgi:hypothetical protein
MAKLAILKVTPLFLVEIHKIGERPLFDVTDGLPADAKIQAIHVNHLTSPPTIDITLSSETFADVAEGKLIPILPPPQIRIKA